MNIAFLILELSPASPKTVKARCQVNWFASLSGPLSPQERLVPESSLPASWGQLTLRALAWLSQPLTSREGEHSRGEGRAPYPDLGRSPGAPGDGTEGPFLNIRPETVTFHPRDLSL